MAYAAGNTDLGEILCSPGCNCSKIVFDRSTYKLSVTAGVLREQSKNVLRSYFASGR